jgi:precorrin-2 dehydrogenase/sirohydrochlorin ferrochelatase
VIVGGGAVATRKALSLHEAGATVRVIAPKVSRQLLDVAGSNSRLTVTLREYAGADDIRDADVVIAATEISTVNSRVAADARSLHRLVSVVSAPADGSFTSMAIHRSGQLTVGVRAGTVPAAAARIRDAIADRFGDRFATALARCAEMRSATLATAGRDEWVLVSESLIGPDFCARVEAGAFEEAAT